MNNAINHDTIENATDITDMASIHAALNCQDYTRPDNKELSDSNIPFHYIKNWKFMIKWLKKRGQNRGACITIELYDKRRGPCVISFN